TGVRTPEAFFASHRIGFADPAFGRADGLIATFDSRFAGWNEAAFGPVGHIVDVAALHCGAGPVGAAKARGARVGQFVGDRQVVGEAGLAFTIGAVEDLTRFGI